jgi:membrane-associated phospholipid phosphatase
MGVSRIFVGYHWPSDILAGAAIGLISGWLINKFSKK